MLYIQVNRQLCAPIDLSVEKEPTGTCWLEASVGSGAL